MSDYQKSMETIFRESAKALGQLACQKLMNEIFKEEDTTTETKPAKKEKEKDADKESRWSRWTKTYTDAFKNSLTSAGLNPDEKEIEKLKKEFVKYINDLTEEDYQKDIKTHTDRMKDFAELKAPKKETTTTTTTTTVEPEKKTAGRKKKTMWEEMNTHETPTDPPSNVVDFHDIKLEDLQTNEFIVTVDGSPEGVFWDGKTGRWVRGPRADDDEDLVGKKFNGQEYMVGEKTGRVYRETDNRDEFVGFVGVGKFKDMKMP